MATTVIALLLVTDSASGPSLVYRWPAVPVSSTRLGRPKPAYGGGISELDSPWKAMYFPDGASAPAPADPRLALAMEDEESYEWRRPNHDRLMSFSHSAPDSSGRNSPAKDLTFNEKNIEDRPLKEGYDDLLGYSSEFLAALLCPLQHSLCHQKFELIVDDLVFVGHPVCAQEDGVWRFKPEKQGTDVTNGSLKHRKASGTDMAATASAGGSSSPTKQNLGHETQSAWLKTFHFVVVIDRPDPSSSASGNVLKYSNIIYEQIAFTVTAVLFQEQVLANFVEEECEILGSLKDDYMAKGESFSDYMSDALGVSSIAPAMKGLYEAIKSSSMAHITLHNLPLELQLPPHLDSLLCSDEENDGDLTKEAGFDAEDDLWGPEFSVGWRLPSLVPWKSLLLMDGQDGRSVNPYENLRGPHVSAEDRALADNLLRFLEHASVTLSLAEMATLLDWNLESQVYPTVRWLVQHRRAKVVDCVHPGLRTVFTLPHKFETPLSILSTEFKIEFSHSEIPSLPQLLSAISASASTQTENHFFAAVVRSKDLIDVYNDVVRWMLKRDLLVALHLRVRVVATTEIKSKVKITRDSARARKMYMLGFGSRGRRDSRVGIEVVRPEQSPEAPNSSVQWLSLSPKSARKQSRRVSSSESQENVTSKLVTSAIEDSEDEKGDYNEEEEEDEEEELWDPREEDMAPSVITDPGKAKSLERRWLSAMSDGKDLNIAKRFEQINQYFDGRRTDDEILYRADITRKQLREVLHHYEEYLQTFLHPS